MACEAGGAEEQRGVSREGEHKEPGREKCRDEGGSGEERSEGAKQTLWKHERTLAFTLSGG